MIKWRINMYPNELVEYRPYRSETIQESIKKMIVLAEGNEFMPASDYWMKVDSVTVIVSQSAQLRKEMQKLRLQLKMEEHCSSEVFEFAANKRRYTGLCSSNRRMDLACRVGRFVQASNKNSDLGVEEILRQTFVFLAELYTREELRSIEKTLWTYWSYGELFKRFSVDTLYRDNGRKKKKRILA